MVIDKQGEGAVGEEVVSVEGLEKLADCQRRYADFLDLLARVLKKLKTTEPEKLSAIAQKASTIDGFLEASGLLGNLLVENLEIAQAVVAANNDIFREQGEQANFLQPSNERLGRFLDILKENAGKLDAIHLSQFINLAFKHIDMAKLLWQLFYLEEIATHPKIVEKRELRPNLARNFLSSLLQNFTTDAAASIRACIDKLEQD